MDRDSSSVLRSRITAKNWGFLLYIHMAQNDHSFRLGRSEPDLDVIPNESEMIYAIHSLSELLAIWLFGVAGELLYRIVSLVMLFRSDDGSLNVKPTAIEESVRKNDKTIESNNNKGKAVRYLI